MNPARYLRVVPLLLGAAIHVHAQQAPVSAPPSKPAVPVASTPGGAALTAPAAPLRPDLSGRGVKQESPATPRKPGGEPKAGMDGVLVRAAKSSKPLELVNPAAPASAGSSDQFLSTHPTTGKTEGIRFFSLRFW